MKILFSIVICCLTGTGNAQFLKKLSGDISNDIRWKVRAKANHKIDQGLDTLLSKPKKNKESSNTSVPQNGTVTKPQQQQSTQTISANVNQKSSENGDEMKTGNGYVTINLSAPEVFTMGTVNLDGKSVKYGNFTSVKLMISGPGTSETQTVPLNEKNSYSKTFQPNAAGDYVLTATSSDGKAKQSKKLRVVDLAQMNWQQNEQEVTKAFDEFKKSVERVNQNLGPKDNANLDKKVEEVEKNVEITKNLFKDLGTAMNDLGDAAKKGASPSPALSGHLSQLNNLLNDQQTKMHQINETIEHTPSDFTICEYLVILNEACAAFQTITNFWSKSIVTIIKNLETDKLVPKAIGEVNASAKGVPSDYDALVKQPGKIFATSKIDAESLTSRLGAVDFTADILQFATDYLMKKYCGVFEGTLKHDYEITYRNPAGVVWWKYSYQTEAAVTFRYPKSNSGKLIKMKGNIEGNVTKFTFYQDVEQEEEFRQAMKSRAKLIPIELYKPVAVPFATSQKDEMGFGAVARALVTPAYFNILIDGDYDTDDETVKLYLNSALVDFTPMVRYTYAFIAIAANIPLITIFDFSINNAKATLNSVVSQNNELKVVKGLDNSLIIKGSGSRHIGDGSSGIEHKINYSLTAKK